MKPITVNLSLTNTIVLYLSWCWCIANPVPSVLGDLKELNESNMWIWASYLCILYEVSVVCLITVTASSRSLLISQCKHTSTTTQSRQWEGRALQRHPHRPIMATRRNYKHRPISTREASEPAPCQVVLSQIQYYACP